jgi:hypothetical protein
MKNTIFISGLRALAPFLYMWIKSCHDGLQGANEAGALSLGPDIKIVFPKFVKKGFYEG